MNTMMLLILALCIILPTPACPPVPAHGPAWHKPAKGWSPIHTKPAVPPYPGGRP